MSNVAPSRADFASVTAESTGGIIDISLEMTGGKSKQTGHSKGATCRQKVFKTKRKQACLDEVFERCVKANSASKPVPQAAPLDPDLPGDGQFHCIPCDRYFQDQEPLTQHFKSKLHKRRMKALQVTPYSVAEAEAAGGTGSYVPPQKVTLPDPMLKQRSEDDLKMCA
ncbi:unnamed protein product [Cyprideis torosa]|uniref:Zinc finger protein 593 homolog n=1 Tax=Cyprideis torosa TaxID=163714 RepID=A0A7R8ZWB5_9CRUS|nr:unnamed protein product [Cyprideis torosa]CAG0904596.1 unnamed protein product [Cyprideis torosa]